jgi:hypothetical protein
MKKAALFLAMVVLLGLVAFLPAWNWFYSAFEDRGRQGNFSQLSFTSTTGEYEIYIDGQSQGTVSNKEQKDFAKIKPGSHVVKITRKSDIADFYYVLERPIEFLPSSLVEIVWEAGPTLESSSGTVKYFTQAVKPNGSEVYVLTIPQSATVEFDSRKSDSNVFEILDTKTHTLKIENGTGFESQTIQVNMNDEATKSVLSDLRLVIEVYLYKQPFK